MKEKRSLLARLSLWLLIPPIAAFSCFFLSLLLYSETFWPLVEALSWYFCYFCEYAAVWFGLLAALVSAAAAAAERWANRKWIRFIICGVGQELFGLFLKAWFEVLMSV